MEKRDFIVLFVVILLGVLFVIFRNPIIVLLAPPDPGGPFALCMAEPNKVSCQSCCSNTVVACITYCGGGVVPGFEFDDPLFDNGDIYSCVNSCINNYVECEEGCDWLWPENPGGPGEQPPRLPEDPFWNPENPDAFWYGCVGLPSVIKPFPEADDDDRLAACRDCCDIAYENCIEEGVPEEICILGKNKCNQKCAHVYGTYT